MCGGVELRGFIAVVRESAGKLLLGSGTRECLMCFECFLEAIFIDFFPKFLRHFLRHLDRESVGIVQVERVDARDERTTTLCDFLEVLRAVVQSFHKRFLFFIECFDDGLTFLRKCPVECSVLVDDFCADGRAETTSTLPDLSSRTDRSTDDATEHVRLVNIARSDAIGNHECRCLEVINDDACVAFTRSFYEVHDRRKRIRLIHILFALEHCRDSFEAHARIHVLLCKRRETPIVILVVLHEDVIPDLHPLCVVRGRIALWFTLADPVEHLGIRSAGAGLARRSPPVLRLGQEADAFARNAEALPDFC